MATVQQWLRERNWTTEAIAEWQVFYNHASRSLISGLASNFSSEYLPHLPEYKDLKPAECKRSAPSSTIRQNSFSFLIVISLCTTLTRYFA